MKIVYSFSLDALPPSVNHLYTRTRRGMIKSMAGKIFEQLAYFSMPKPEKAIDVPCIVSLTFTFAKGSTMRRRDLDNMLKATLDAMQARGVFTNDNVVFEIECRKMEGKKDGVSGTVSVVA